MFFLFFVKFNVFGMFIYVLYLFLGVIFIGMFIEVFVLEKIMVSLINVVSFMVIIVWISISVA